MCMLQPLLPGRRRSTLHSRASGGRRSRYFMGRKTASARTAEESSYSARAVGSMSGRPNSSDPYPLLIVMLPTVVDTLIRCGEELFRLTSTCCSPIVVSVVTA